MRVFVVVVLVMFLQNTISDVQPNNPNDSLSTYPLFTSRKLINNVFMMTKLENLCFGSKICVRKTEML